MASAGGCGGDREDSDEDGAIGVGPGVESAGDALRVRRTLLR